ncbi:ABC transporter ATP-binding protein [Roseibium sediminicola]|uniref:ABC transporter ATP-binding protein n=1 Tax=Roseibium sediminicola TaxID=2933272 RepID=A0ABT0H1Z0_9HYPH|nr:ABC transporter ATP-binding protein [Roseibium sp. CAU 1639]MCK7615710.1 ABC transporter ATP-binding protein [Roseibium sp. CAU 1639]
MLTIKDLCVDFPVIAGVVHAVADVDISLKAGKRVGFVGESGSGKTTTALAVMRMIKKPGHVSKGEIRLGDTDILSLSPEEMRQTRLCWISYIPQGAMNSLNPVMRIEQQIWDGIVDHEGTFPIRELRRRSDDAIAGVGLPARVGRMFPHELSGGMKQRACIAIATALKPELIIADEPTSALDVITQRQVMETLEKAQEAIGSALILIGHDMGLMAQCVDKLMVMKDGRIVERGAIRDIFTKPEHPYTRQLISSVPSIGGESFLPKLSAEPVAGRRSGDAPLLEFDGVSKVYGGGFLSKKGNTALYPLSFALDGRKPKIISIVGQSGSGKSTLGGLMLGFSRPTTGEVMFEGRNIATLGRAATKSLRKDIQAVFQDPYGAFNPYYRVERALSLPLKRFGISSDAADVRTRCAEACRGVGLDPSKIFGRFPHELSGGQRQRLMVARALMLSPKLLIADEPVSMVDASLRASILKNLYDLKDKHGISIVYITHDLATAYHVSDYVIVLHEGHVAEAGPPKDVIGNPQHPYTRLLVNSIPWPDVDRQWGTSASAKEEIEALMKEAKGHPPVDRGSVPGFELAMAS